jgi:hypothetical protein
MGGQLNYALVIALEVVCVFETAPAGDLKSHVAEFSGHFQRTASSPHRLLRLAEGRVGVALGRPDQATPVVIVQHFGEGLGLSQVLHRLVQFA